MNNKTLAVLEYKKILSKVAEHCSFSASKDLALDLMPDTSFDTINKKLKETSEARVLLSKNDVSVGGAHDIRGKVKLANRGGVLDPTDLLDIKYSLIASRELRAFFLGKKQPGEKVDKFNKAIKPEEESPDLDLKKYQYPYLTEHAALIQVPPGIIDLISKTISDKGEVMDNASDKLRSLRAELHIAKNRLLSRLQHYLGDTKTNQMLQESLITQRDGRYVIPLKSESKGQIKSIIHDQSASGATLFIEPLAVVELNNELKEVELAERNEVRRILSELSGQIGVFENEISESIDALATIDLIFAKANYADQINASEPILFDSKDQTESKRIYLLKARHPLLDPKTSVANNIDLLPGTKAIVITGPNTGGKTVTLKTVGLLVLMAQSGMHIPAQSGSELSIFDNVFADIGDEQSIEQSLSTFSGHLTNIVNILKEADDRSLVIFDELGAGTDPQEGSSLAMAILNNLLKKNITTFVATHYPELKTFAHNTLAVTNASLEFDVATLRPTYRLTIGLPGRSNALAIASRLGLPDEIIQDAKQGINPENLKADKLLDDIRRERNKASKEREKVTKTRQKNEALNNDLATRLEKIEDERLETINKAKAEAELELEILKRNIGRLRAEMKKLHMTTGDVDKLEKKVEKISEKSQQPEVRKTVVEEPTKDVKFKLGEKIYVRNLDKVGILTSLAEEEGEVQIGNIRIRTKLTEIQKVSEIEKPAITTANSRQQRIKKAANNITISADANIKMSYSLPSPGIELDIRGKTSEDGLSLLGDYIDRAYLSGLPFARIIHGKGTGKLRQEVRSYLSGNEQVSSIEEGHPNEGGDGVTIVKFIKD
jgi:DNA mismatch repair protein MutS2